MAGLPGRPISPLIYGVAAAQPEDLAALRPALHRWGGNPASRYNWELGNAWNSARDWEFRNGTFGNDAAEHRRPSGVADQFVRQARAAGAEPLLTVPALGWVARDTSNESRASVRSRARKGAAFASPPDTRDDLVYQDEWVHYLKTTFGGAAQGGVRYYAVDNEPDLWDVTHSDVRPEPLGYDDLRDVFLEYATAIKDVDPGALILGPALSGWTGINYSPRDRGVDNFKLHLERRAHGDVPLLQWWLAQVRQHDERVGRRTLDYLDVHWYPQGQNVFSPSADSWTSALRLRSTRALWDSGYKDESWIGDRVRLIPRLRELIEKEYPGTKLAIGEWNWGAEQDISGALAIADVLGIFGREGVDLAAYWTVPPRGSLAAAAFTLYTNVDGRGTGIGSAALPVELIVSPDDLTVYAARDEARKEVTVVAVNKRPTNRDTVAFALEGVTPSRPARVYQLSAASPALRELPEAQIEGRQVTLDLPPHTATLVRRAY